MLKLLQFLDRLEELHASYTLLHVRETIMVCVAVPGERWEVEFFENGDVEVERFISTAKLAGEEAIECLLSYFEG